MADVLDTVGLLTVRAPSWRRWTLACAAGETIGMAVAAGAAGLSVAVVGEPHDARGAVLALGLPVLGGAVEGLAVGLLQFRVLGEWLTGLSRRAWVGATVAVATVLWFLGMLPSTLVSWLGTPAPSSSTGSGPPGWVMPVVGVVSGLLAGAVFGAAQARVLRGQVDRPRTWVLANALGWSLALLVIFTGASIPDGAWSWPTLLALGAVTGVLAGLAIGAVTGLFLPSLDETAPRSGGLVNRWVLGVLRSPAHRLLSGSLLDLRYVGAVSGRTYALPVQYAVTEDGFVVVPGHPETKSWWHNFRTGHPVVVLHAGQCRSATAVVVDADDPDRAALVAAYRERYPKVAIPDGAPVVGLRVGSAVVHHAHEPEVRVEIEALERSGIRGDRQGH